MMDVSSLVGHQYCFDSFPLARGGRGVVRLGLMMSLPLVMDVLMLQLCAIVFLCVVKGVHNTRQRVACSTMTF